MLIDYMLIQETVIKLYYTYGKLVYINVDSIKDIFIWVTTIAFILDLEKLRADLKTRNNFNYHRTRLSN